MFTFPYAYPISTFAFHAPYDALNPTRISGIAKPSLNLSSCSLALKSPPSNKIRPEGFISNFSSCALAAPIIVKPKVNKSNRFIVLNYSYSISFLQV